MEGHEGGLSVLCVGVTPSACLFICLNRSWESEASRVTCGMCFNVLFLPQMKMIIALVVVALLLIIISEYLTSRTRTV